MKRFSILFIYLIISISNLFSQISIKGKIVDSLGQPIQYATVVLFKNDTLYKGTISEQNGFFKLNDINNDIYKLSISYIGYENYNKQIDFVRDTVLETIVLNPNDNVLNEIEINAEKNEIQLLASKTVFKISKKTREKALNSYILLSTIPELQINTIDNGIRLNGNNDGNLLILINNIPRDKNDLATLNPKDIEQVEIITNPSAKYLSQDISGVINVVTKSSNTGISSYTELKVNPLLKVAFLNGKFRYSKNKFSIYIKPFLSILDEKDTEKKDVYTSYYNDYLIKEERNSKDASFYMYGGDIKTGIDYQFNSSSFIAIDFYINGIDAEGNENYEGIINNNDELLTTYNSSIFKNSKENARKINTYYQKKYDRILFVLNTGYNHFFSKYDLDYEKIASSGLYFNNHFITNNNKQSVFVQPDFSMDIKSHQLSLGYRFYYQDVSQILTSDADAFEYQEYIHFPYLNFSGAFNSFSYNASCGFESSNIILKNGIEDVNYFNILPTLSLNYNISKSNSLNFSLNQKIKKPKVAYLNPNLYYTDSIVLISGNSELEPYIVNSASTSYTYKKSNVYLKFSFNYQNIKNDISKVGEIENSIYNASYINAIESEFLYSSVLCRLNFLDNNLSFNSNLSAYYQKYKNKINNFNSELISFGFNFSSSYSYKDFYFSLSYRYSPKYLRYNMIVKNGDDSWFSVYWQPNDILTLGGHIRYLLGWNEYNQLDDFNFSHSYNRNIKDRNLVFMLNLSVNLSKGVKEKRRRYKIKNYDSPEEIKLD